MQPGLFRLGGICFLPLAGGAPYTEGGAHGVPPLGHACGATAPQSSGAEPERAPHGSEYGENPFAPARMCRKKLCKNTETGIDKSVLLY